MTGRPVKCMCRRQSKVPRSVGNFKYQPFLESIFLPDYAFVAKGHAEGADASQIPSRVDKFGLRNNHMDFDSGTEAYGQSRSHSNSPGKLCA